MIAPYGVSAAVSEFSPGLCNTMSERGLFGVVVPKPFGGRGFGWKDLAEAGAALAFEGGNMGIVLSWIVHEIVTGFIVRKFGIGRGEESMMMDSAGGRKIISLAVSEQGAGAHPKYLKTYAEAVSGGFRLNGEKTWLTNGPVADWFVVVAVSGKSGNKNRFSAFLVPANTPGLIRSEPFHMPFVRSSPHGGIKMTDCIVPPESLIGCRDSAYEDMVVPFRWCEDAIMLRVIMAGMERQMRLAAALARIPHEPAAGEIKMDAGRLMSMIESGKTLSREAAESIDLGTHRTGLLIFLRALTTDFQGRFRSFAGRLGVEANEELDVLTSDLKGLGAVAGRAADAETLRMGDRWTRSGDLDGGL